MTAVPQQLLHRSKFLLCKLIGAIADADNPIVLVMDDLQWADATSLSVFETIVTDPGKFYTHVPARCVLQWLTSVGKLSTSNSVMARQGYLCIFLYTIARAHLHHMYPLFINL